MLTTPQELYAVLRQFNPWWAGAVERDLPTWRRDSYAELWRWITAPPTERAVLLSGARRVGKTTLLRQAIQSLLGTGVAPGRILYATFDHPLLRLIGLSEVLRIWEELQPKTPGETDFLFLDEVQNCADWQVWLKHQVDFAKGRRIAVTGSALPLAVEQQESGVGRWHALRLPTLSFYEYLRVRNVEEPALPEVRSLRETAAWPEGERLQAAGAARGLIPHFHEYLLRGGFPETARIADVSEAQKLLREDIVDRVLKRDMTALYGVRHVLDLEKLFLYLCLHDGGILDVAAAANALQMNRPKVGNFLALLESAHLIYRLWPHGYGKQVLRGQPKVYLADPALSGSVLLRGRDLLADAARLGAAVEAAFFKHVYTRLYPASVRFSYWREPKKQYEVDLIAEVGADLIPFEVKQQSAVRRDDLKGLLAFCELRRVPRAYVITREINDFRSVRTDSGVEILHVPAVLACYWLSRSELQ